MLCLFLCLPEIVRDLKSSRAFPFVGWTRPHQRHSPCCGISDTIWEILPMLCHAVPFRAKSTSTLSVFLRITLSSSSPEIDCAAVGFGGLAFWDVAQLSQCASMLLWSAQVSSRSWLFLLRRTRCFEQEEAVEPPALLALNTAVVASAEPQSRTTSSSALEAAVGRHAPADRNTRAMASA